jgi:general secretion pathway protein D
VDLESLLDLMLLSKNYVYELDDRVIRIGPRAGFVQRRITKTFRTKFANALDLRRLITSRLSPTGKVEFLTSSYGLPNTGGISGGVGTSGGVAAGGGGGAAAIISRAFIVTDFITVLRDVERIVRLADVLPRQVGIDVQLIEIELDANQALGINWNLQASLTGSSASTPFPLGKPQPFGATGTGTFVFGTTNFQNLTAAFRALTNQNKIHTLSKPSVTTLDGQEANILVGDKFPIITENVNAQTGLRTTSLNGTIDIGIQLRVVPQILDPDRIALSIHPTVSSQGALIQQLAPVVNTREVRTQLMVKQGETAVIGGLIQERTERVRTGIPALLHLDVIGHLFGQRTTTLRKNELMVFVTPHILDRPSAPREPERRVIRRLARAEGYAVK